MQRPDEKKRQGIAKTAAKLFATRPFHKVKLDDVAAEAGVGKGTLYIYFKSKEDLYFSLIYDGFAALLERVQRELGEGAKSPAESLRLVVNHLVHFSFEHPELFEVMRSSGALAMDPRWTSKREELTRLLEQVIRSGNASGEFNDPEPAMTAICVPGLVRSVMLFGPKGLSESRVSAQIFRLIEQGIASRGRGEAR